MRNKVLVSALPLLLLTLGAAQTLVCPDEHANERQAISFLKASRLDSHVPDHCVVSAIRRLEHSHSADAIHVLVEYLGWKESEPSQVTTGSSMFHPAVGTLFSIGKPALPALTEVLVDTNASKVARDNAVETIMCIFRDDSKAGVRFLLKKASEARDGGEASMLRQAASSATRWCGDDTHRSECEAVLNSE